MLRQLLRHLARQQPLSWRFIFCAVIAVATLLTICTAPMRIRSLNNDFPKMGCLSSSRLPLARKIPSSLFRHLGNWSFEEPARLAKLCRPDARQTNHEFPVKRASFPQTLLAIVPITSEMSEQRKDLRLTWGSELNKNFGQLLFLVQLEWGTSPPKELMLENQRQQDILIAYHNGEPRGDSYGTLVLKMIAGLQWYAKACRRGFKFVLKSDYDSYWNVESLVNLLLRHRHSEPLVLGSVQESASVLRDPQSDFYVSQEAYSDSHFPAYVSGGPGYAMSRAAAVSIASLAEYHVPRNGALWLEDVYITGLLPAVGYSTCNGSSSSAFLHLHSDYVYICRYMEFTAEMVTRWPPLAMHRVRGRQLHDLHAWARSAVAAEIAQKKHSIVYSRKLCEKTGKSLL